MNNFLIYVLVALCMAYILNHQLSIVRLISTKSDLKLRQKIVLKQKQLELYIKLCPVWPMLLVKEIYDEVKSR